MSNEILTAYGIWKDQSSHNVNCPHCKELVGVEGNSASEIYGEQFTCKCGGVFEVRSFDELARSALITP